MLPRGGDRKAMAIPVARIARSPFVRLLMAQPITHRECRSRIATRYSQSSQAQRQLISTAHFRFGRSAVTARSSRFGALFNLGSLSVLRRDDPSTELFADPASLRIGVFFQ